MRIWVMAKCRYYLCHPMSYSGVKVFEEENTSSIDV